MAQQEPRTSVTCVDFILVLGWMGMHVGTHAAALHCDDIPVFTLSENSAVLCAA